MDYNILIEPDRVVFETIQGTEMSAYDVAKDESTGKLYIPLTTLLVMKNLKADGLNVADIITAPVPGTLN